MKRYILLLILTYCLTGILNAGAILAETVTVSLTPVAGGSNFFTLSKSIPAKIQHFRNQTHKAMGLHLKWLL